MFDDSIPIEHIDPDVLTLHPVVYLFPQLSEDRFESLVNNIRANGQIDPVWITSNGEIFDGRHRWRAAKLLGKKVLCRRLKDSGAEILTNMIDRVIAQHIERRHLTRSQRSLALARLRK